MEGEPLAGHLVCSEHAVNGLHRDHDHHQHGLTRGEWALRTGVWVNMYACVRLSFIHAEVCMCARVRTCVPVLVFMQRCAHLVFMERYACVHMHACVRMSLYSCRDVHVCTCVHVYACPCIHAEVCMCACTREVHSCVHLLLFM